MTKQRILIVDDDPDFVEATKTILTKAGYDVAFAYDGESGLKKLKQYEPDLLILDAMMPLGSEGFYVSYEIRKDPKFVRLPILMISALTTRYPFEFSPEKDGPFLPVERFIDKPISPEQLIREVQTLLPKVEEKNAQCSTPDA